MTLWIDIKKPKPGERYTHSVTNNEDAKRLIKECEEKGETIRLINVDENGIELMQWLLNRQTMYPVIYHCDNERKIAALQEMFETHWLIE